MPILIDTSFLYALYNRIDSHHQRAMDYSSQNTDTILIPDVILPEVSYLFYRDLGYFGVQRFLEHFRLFNGILLPIEKVDMKRV